MRTICLLFLLAIVCSPTMAQEATGSKYGDRDGRGGLLFYFSRLNLGGFGGFGGKYWLSDQWAMNASVTLYQRNVDRSYNGGSGSTQEYQTTNLGFHTAVERHLLRARFSPFIGAGLSYSYGYSKSSAAGSSSSSEHRTDRHGAVISLRLGAEFWLSRNFSLAGQYYFSGRYYTDQRTDTQSDGESREYSFDQWNINSGGGGLLLAVYF